VEPRGFEPLTSAVQYQSSNITRVCRCSKTRAKRCILCANISRLLAAVRAGWCTTVYKGPRQSTTQFSSSAFSLQNSTFLSGRCWVRTSVLCRVKAAPYRCGFSLMFRNTCKTQHSFSRLLAPARYCSPGLAYYWRKHEIPIGRRLRDVGRRQDGLVCTP
jgi:hypothetical protein